MLKGRVIAENDTAFLTENSIHRGIYLIMPVQHLEKLEDLPDNWWASFKQLLPSVPNMTENDYNVSINVGPVAGQTLKHLHFWIIPRYNDQPASNIGMAGLINIVNQG